MLCKVQFFFIYISSFIFLTLINPQLTIAAPGDVQENFFEIPEKQEVRLSGLKLELFNMNPNMNKWFVLKVSGAQRLTLHLENTDSRIRLVLNEYGIGFANSSLDRVGGKKNCNLWNNPHFNLLHSKFRYSHNPFMSLCDGRLYLRNLKSSKTKLSVVEWATDLLRKNKYGESIINAFKPFLVSLHMEEGETVKIGRNPNKTFSQKTGFPKFAKSKYRLGQERQSANNSLMMSIKNDEKYMRFGHFYETSWYDGVFVSVNVQNHLPHDIVNSFPNRVNKLSKEEKDALVYTVAYDLDKYTINYAVGVDQPGIAATSKKWHPTKNRLNKALVPIGSVPTYMLRDSIGIFIGGFKRYHAKIRKGPYAGKTYGFIENGVELEPMTSDLATIFVKKDGSIDIKEWPKSKQDQKILRKDIVGARQNGVMVVKNGEPTAFVNKRYAGAWSGDVKGRLQTLRSGVCTQEKDNKKFLLYFFLTAATPSSLARAMQAYDCVNGFQLDMNAHVFVYNTLFKLNKSNKVKMQLLHEQMQWPRDANYHRFIVDNNKRDFFFIYKKENPFYRGPGDGRISKK